MPRPKQTGGMALPAGASAGSPAVRLGLLSDSGLGRRRIRAVSLPRVGDIAVVVQGVQAMTWRDRSSITAGRWNRPDRYLEAGEAGLPELALRSGPGPAGRWAFTRVPSMQIPPGCSPAPPGSLGTPTPASQWLWMAVAEPHSVRRRRSGAQRGHPGRPRAGLHGYRYSRRHLRGHSNWYCKYQYISRSLQPAPAAWLAMATAVRHGARSIRLQCRAGRQSPRKIRCSPSPA